MKYPTSNSKITDLASGFDDQLFTNKSSNFWSKYISSGTSLWVDTGDISIAKSIWCDEFSALTTNNSLINNEVQKGTYDELLTHLSGQIKGLNNTEKIKEIAFCINAIHGLRLVKCFNRNVSLELHTDLAHDIDGIYHWGIRLHSICPDKFIIKIPFTASGLIGARRLFRDGVAVNLTLGFSVRQNAFAAVVAKAKYCNVFLGRIGAYFKNNNISDGLDIGEKVVAETQHCMRTINKNYCSNTKLIAASIRSAPQLLNMIGTDTYTIPTKIIQDAINQHIQPKKSLINSIAGPQLPAEISSNLNFKHLWQVKDYEKQTILHLGNKLPNTSTELEDFANANGCHDIFIQLNEEEQKTLKDDGKIPIHRKWATKLYNNEVGIDTLLNAAGLYAFMADQKKLDDRIGMLI